MKNQKNGSNSPKMHPRAKVPITDPPEVWVSSFQNIDRNGKLVLAIMKSQKNGSNSPKMHPRANSQLPTPLKFGSEVLRVLMQMENWCQLL